MFPSRLVSVLGGGVGLENTYSLDFDGTNDYVAIPDSSDLDVTGDFTLMAWSKLDAGHQEQDGIVAKTDGSGDGYGLYYGKDGTDWDINFFSSKYNVAQAISTAITMGEWNHIVGVHDSTAGSNSLYWNGILVHSLTSSVANYANNAVDLSIGRTFSDSTAYNHDGSINEVALWNTALSAGDIYNLYLARGTADLNDDGNSPNLKGWWRMGDGVLDDFNLIADQVTPTLGSELWDSPASTNGSTSNWTEYGTNGLETDDGAIKITFEDNDDGAKFFFKDASDLSSDLIVGALYKFQLDAKVNTGSVNLRTTGGGVHPTAVTNTDFQTFTIYFVATSVDSNIFRTNGLSSGEIIWLDNFSLKRVNGNPGIMTNMASDDIVKDTP